jgi:D-alanyl-D-alanine carboxypeptidase
MKAFFSILFGGLLILVCTIGLFSLGTVVWKNVAHQVNPAVVADALASQGSDNYSVPPPSARYSASEEEDVINSAALSLPKNGVQHVQAKAYLVKDLTTGTVIVDTNASQLLPIASLTKLVTAVIARRLIPDSTHITITKSVMATYGNTADFTAGETFSAGNLLYPLLMVSSNDAAEAYAEYYGRAKFIGAMNDFTQSIGAYRTSFSDPSGLDPRNVSTADDMAIIIDWIRKNDPAIIDVTELKAYTVRSHTWINPTHFLSWSYYVGGKNGYLPEADRTNVSLFKWGSKGDVYAIVVLGSPNRDADTIALLKKIQP